MTRLLIITTTAVILLFVLLACQAQSDMDCAEIDRYFAPIQNFVSQNDTINDFEADIRRSNVFDSSTITSFSYPKGAIHGVDGGISVRFRDINSHIYAASNRENLQSVGIPDIGAYISTNDILECYGEPKKYNALLYQGEQNTVSLILYYPQHGIVFVGNTAPTEPIQLSKVQPTSVIFTPADLSIEEMVNRSGIFNTDLGADLQETSKPWPKNIEDLTID